MPPWFYTPLHPAARLSAAQKQLVTMLEEERIQAYYGAGTLYAEPGRAEPLLEALARIDIGLMPLPPEDWAKVAPPVSQATFGPG